MSKVKNSRTKYVVTSTGALAVLKDKFADLTAGQDTAVLTAVAGKKIRVYFLALQSSGTATAITFKSKPSGTAVAITCVIALGINSSFVLPYNEQGYFETAAGEGLTITAGAGSAVGLQFLYAEV